MNSYLELVKEYNRIHKKKNRMIVICIAVAVSLITAVFGMAQVGVKIEREQIKQTYGNYHIVFNSVDKKTDFLKERSDILYIGTIGEMQSTNYEGKKVRLMGIGGDSQKQSGLKKLEGTMPKEEKQVLVNKRATETFGWKVGDKISPAIDGKQNAEQFKIVGIVEDTAATEKKEEYSLIFSIEGIHKLKDKYNNRYMERCYITLKKGVNPENFINYLVKKKQIAKEQIGTNKYMDFIDGNSDENIAVSFYTVAVILFVLVFLSGCIMVGNSLNIGVLERIKFFGLLRCIGATRKQIRKYIHSGYTA